MQKITLYREDNGQYSTSEAKQDDISGVYVQVEEIEQLKQENAELRISAGIAASFAAKVRMECRKAIESETYESGFIALLHESANAALSKSSEQALNDIKADAVLSIMDEEYSCETPTGDMAFSSTSIQNHAEKLRNK